MEDHQGSGVLIPIPGVGLRASDDERRSRWVGRSRPTRPPVVGSTIGHVDRGERHLSRSVSPRVSSLNLADLLTDQARATMSVDPADESAVRLLVSSVRIAPSLINPYAALADWFRAGGEHPYRGLRDIWETHGADDQSTLRFVEQHRAGDPSAIVADWCDGRGRAEVLVQVSDDLSYLDIYDTCGVGERPPTLVGRVHEPRLVCSPRDFGELPATKQAIAEDLVKRGKDFRVVAHRGTSAGIGHRAVFGPTIDTVYLNSVLHDTVFRSSLVETVSRVAEIGTGSGFLLCSLLESLRARPLELSASDIEGLAIETARANVAWALARVGRADSVRVHLERTSELLERLPSASVDLLISNPPYIPERQYAGENAYSGTRVIESVVSDHGPRVVARGGVAIVLFSSLAEAPMRDCLRRSPWVPVALAPARRVPLDLREVLRDPVWMQMLRRTTDGLEETLDDTSYLHWHGLHVLALCHPQDRSLIAELQDLARSADHG